MENKKIKICHIVSIDITVRFLLMPQLQFLRAQGYEVYAICSPGTWTKEIEDQGVHVKHIKITRNVTPFTDLVSLWQLFWYFRKEKFSIVHTHAPKPGLLGQVAAKLAGVPIIINTVHGLYFTEHSSWQKKMFFVFLEKIAAKCSTLIFSQNREDIQTMIDEKIAKADKLEYLGNGINMDRFSGKNSSPELIAEKKRELGISENIKIIGTVGRLVKEKGYLDLFEAMKLILIKHPNTMLLAIGPKEPDKKDALNPDIVKEYGIENNVIFLGERKDVEMLYPLMDIFVLASHREGFPRSVIEAMVMKRPIIVTDIRGCREEITDAENGLMVPLKNPLKLAEAILFLLESPQRAQEFAIAAHKKALKEFDEKIVFEKIKEAYGRLLQQ